MVSESEITPTVVGREFVRQYYTLLHTSPSYMYRFYSQDSSYLHGSIKGEERQSYHGQDEIRKRMATLNFTDTRATIRHVDAQMTVGNGIVVQVSGEFSGDGSTDGMKRFMQTFVLAPQGPRKYYVHNDIFRCEEEIDSDSGAYVIESRDHGSDPEDVAGEGEAASEENGADGETEAAAAKVRRADDGGHGDSSLSLHTSTQSDTKVDHHSITSMETTADSTCTTTMNGAPGPAVSSGEPRPQQVEERIDRTASPHQMNWSEVSEQPEPSATAVDHNSTVTTSAGAAAATTAVSSGATETATSTTWASTSDNLSDRPEADQQLQNASSITRPSQPAATVAQAQTAAAGRPSSAKGKSWANVIDSSSSSSSPSSKVAAGGGAWATPSSVSSATPPPGHSSTASHHYQQQQQLSSTAQHHQVCQSDASAATTGASQPDGGAAGGGVKGARPGVAPSFGGGRPHREARNVSRFSGAHSTDDSEAGSGGTGPPMATAPSGWANGGSGASSGRFEDGGGVARLPGARAMPPSRPLDSHQLFIGNLPHDVTETELKEYFGQFGRVIHTRITSNHNAPGFAFIIFDGEEPPRRALDYGLHYIRDRHRINVEEKKPRINRGGGGMGGPSGLSGAGRGGFRGGGGFRRGMGPQPPYADFNNQEDSGAVENSNMGGGPGPNFSTSSNRSDHRPPGGGGGRRAGGSGGGHDR